MIEERYNLVFEGQLEPGHEQQAVASTLEQLFQFAPDTASLLFSGQLIVLGEKMDAATANAFAQALAGAGARTRVVAADALDEAREQRQQMRRIHVARRARSRSSAIMPDRRVNRDRRD